MNEYRIKLNKKTHLFLRRGALISVAHGDIGQIAVGLILSANKTVVYEVQTHCLLYLSRVVVFLKRKVQGAEFMASRGFRSAKDPSPLPLRST